MSLLTRYGIIPAANTIFVPEGQTRLELVQSLGCTLYLDGLKADGVGLPLNSPLLTTWSDLIGDNDFSLTGFAGTSLSGWNTYDVDNPYLKFGGDNDKGLSASDFVLPDSFTVYTRIISPKISGVDQRAWIGVDRAEGGTTGLFGVESRSSLGGKILAYMRNTAGATFTVQSDSEFTEGTSVKVAITYNGTTKVIKMYINGVLQASTATLTGTRGTSTNKLMIGAGYYDHNPYPYYNGGLNSILFCPSELSQVNIQAIVSKGI